MKEILKEKEKGITLIALVITIVILLILAGVSIAMLTGDNGILTQANNAKERTEKGEEYELRKLTQAEAATHLEEYEYKDHSGKILVIPAKCAVSRVEGENTLENGLVIIDINGNEWVWVEVSRTEEVYPNTGINLDVNNITDEQCSTIYEDLTNYASAYRKIYHSDEFFSTEQSGFENANEYNATKNNMLRSIYKNEGFWIGRYEVGIEDSFRNYENDTQSEHPITEIPVIKANAYPYTYVRCSQAQTLSKQLAIGEKTSSLIFGIQWDLTCKFLEVKTNLEENDINSDSSSWGNYSNSPITLSIGKFNTNPSSLNSQWLDIIQKVKDGEMILTTGASEDAKKMNIYDFAGNVWEWTLEYSFDKTYPCTFRSGYFGNLGSERPAAWRSNNITSYNALDIGFRATLY